MIHQSLKHTVQTMSIASKIQEIGDVSFSILNGDINILMMTAAKFPKPFKKSASFALPSENMGLGPSHIHFSN